MRGFALTIEGFTVEDVTLKNPRMQSKVAEEIKEKSGDKDLQDYLLTSIPQVAIIERAIKFYEDNAEGEYKILYSATAKWLRQFMSVPSQQKKEEVIEVTLDEIKNETENGENLDTE